MNKNILLTIMDHKYTPFKIRVIRNKYKIFIHELMMESFLHNKQSVNKYRSDNGLEFELTLSFEKVKLFNSYSIKYTFKFNNNLNTTQTESFSTDSILINNIHIFNINNKSQDDKNKFLIIKNRLGITFDFVFDFIIQCLQKYQKEFFDDYDKCEEI